jgi:hypothetical protein
MISCESLHLLPRRVKLSSSFRCSESPRKAGRRPIALIRKFHFEKPASWSGDQPGHCFRTPGPGNCPHHPAPGAGWQASGLSSGGPMKKVIDKRMAAEMDGEFVVFLIGMRINKPWKLHKWLPVFLAMPKMLKELQAHPESGFLGHSGLGRIIVQYWRSFQHLEAYARSKEKSHWPAWVDFNRRVGHSRDQTGTLRSDIQRHASVWSRQSGESDSCRREPRCGSIPDERPGDQPEQ